MSIAFGFTHQSMGGGLYRIVGMPKNSSITHPIPFLHNLSADGLTIIRDALINNEINLDAYLQSLYKHTITIDGEEFLASDEDLNRIREINEEQNNATV